MKLTITNLTQSYVSTDIGLLFPISSINAELTPGQLYKTIPGVNILRDSGRIIYTIDETTADGDVVDENVFFGSVVADNIRIDGVYTHTNAATVLYVAPTGLDSNPGTALLPFLTIQAAIDLIPKNVRHLVTVNVAAGNYSGFALRGFSIAPQGSVQAGINIVSPLITATIGSGSTTGTITSKTNGSLSTPAFFVLNDSTQTWAVDALVGLIVEITLGVGLGSSGTIISNTATSMEITGVSFGGATIGSGYTIKDRGAIIDTPVVLPLPVGATSSSGTYGIHVTSNRSSAYGTAIQIDGFKVSLNANFAIRMEDTTQLRIERCHLAIAGSTSGLGASTLRMDGPGQVSISRTFINTVGGKDGIVIFGFGLNVGFSTTIIAGAGLHQFSVAGGATINFTGCSIDGGGIGFSVSDGSVLLQGSRITDVSSQAIRIKSNNSAGTRSAPACFVTLSGVNISNCGTAVETSGLAFVDNSPGVAIGTGNTTAWSMISGARVQVHASTTLTGTTEVNVDGTTTTLATMRGNSPKIVSSPYFSIMYE